MKQLMKIVMIVGLCLSSLSVLSREVDSFKIKNTELTLKRIKPGQKFLIKDENGNVMYQEALQGEGSMRKRLDLSNLPVGKYTLEIDRDYEIEITPITIMPNQVLVKEEERHIYFKPVIRSKNDLLYISKMTFNKEPLRVKIYFEDSDSASGYDLIYSDVLKDAEILSQVYKLDPSKKGTYRIVTTSNHRTFKNTIKI